MILFQYLLASLQFYLVSRQYDEPTIHRVGYGKNYLGGMRYCPNVNILHSNLENQKLLEFVEI